MQRDSDYRVTADLCAFLAKGRLEDIPADVIERGKYLILDGIGCGLIGARLPWSTRAVDVMEELEGDGRATIWGWGKTTTASTAALLNGTFVQGFELDDFHPAGPLHSAACVLTSVLATAEHLGGVDGRRFLEAVLYGYEVGPRVGMIFDGMALVGQGWHCGSLFGAFASAAGAGKLRRLDVEGFENAIGLAATHASGLMAAQYEAMVKRMHSGMAARNGLVSAALADGGFTGIKSVIERDYGGFAVTFAGGTPVRFECLTDGLGERWEISRIGVKAYSCVGGAVHSAIDAALRLRDGVGFDPSEIEEIDVGIGEAMYHHVGWPLHRPPTTIGAQMSLAYALAVALLDGDVFVTRFAPERLNADDVWALIERTTVRYDPNVDKLGQWGAVRLRISMKHGHGQALEVHEVGSLLPRHLTNQDILDKFRRMGRLVTSTNRISALENTILGIEEIGDIAELSRLLKDPVTAPF